MEWKQEAAAAYENAQELYAEYVRALPEWYINTFYLPIFLAQLGIRADAFVLGGRDTEYDLMAIIDDEYQIAEISTRSEHGSTKKIALFHREEYVRQIESIFDLGAALWIAQRTDELSKQDEDGFPRGRAHV
jgi:hypothetical protein